MNVFPVLTIEVSIHHLDNSKDLSTSDPQPLHPHTTLDLAYQQQHPYIQTLQTTLGRDGGPKARKH